MLLWESPDVFESFLEGVKQTRDSLGSLLRENEMRKRKDKFFFVNFAVYFATA